MLEPAELVLAPVVPQKSQVASRNSPQQALRPLGPRGVGVSLLARNLRLKVRSIQKEKKVLRQLATN